MKKYFFMAIDKDNTNGMYYLGDYYKDINDFKKMVKDKAVTENTIVFNNLINTFIFFSHNYIFLLLYNISLFIWPSKYAFIKISISPSIILCMFPVSSFVL